MSPNIVPKRDKVSRSSRPLPADGRGSHVPEGGPESTYLSDECLWKQLRGSGAGLTMLIDFVLQRGSLSSSGMASWY